MKKTALLLLLLASTFLGCLEEEDPQVRFVNGFFVSIDAKFGSAEVSNLGAGETSGFKSVSEGTHDVQFKLPSEDTWTTIGPESVSNGKKYELTIYLPSSATTSIRSTDDSSDLEKYVEIDLDEVE